RTNVARSVNTTQVIANWLIGREIVEEEQRGKARADYGKAILKGLSEDLQAEFGRGFSIDNLEFFRNFFLGYPRLLGEEKSDAVRRKLSGPSSGAKQRTLLVQGEASPANTFAILGTAGQESWQPGQLHPGLSWTHYRTLLRVEKPEGRDFYEIEAIQNR